MNAKRVFCKKCEWPMCKVIAHTGKGNIPLGSYCPKCKKIFDLDGSPLFKEVPITRVHVPRPDLNIIGAPKNWKDRSQDTSLKEYP